MFHGIHKNKKYENPLINKIITTISIKEELMLTNNINNKIIIISTKEKLMLTISINNKIITIGTKEKLIKTNRNIGIIENINRLLYINLLFHKVALY